MHDDALEHVPDEALLATVRRLAARSNVALADLLAHLGEVERRGIHRERACASLYTYCIYELRMSEDAAFRRAKAARLVRRYPEVRDAIAQGEIHLTGVLMIAPYLGGEHHEEVLRRSRFRSKRELCRLVAEMDPKPAVPALVEPIGPAPAGPASYAAHVESMTGAVRELPEGSRPEDWIDEGEPETHETRSGETRVANVASWPGTDRPLRYKVQFTASQQYVDLLEEAVALLGHERPRPALPDVQLRALELLVAKLRKERCGERGEAKTEASDGAAPARVSSPERDDRGGDRGPDGAAPARVSSPERDDRGGDRGPDGAAPARVLPAGGERPRRGHESHGRYVRRIVWGRDGARCAYVDDRGVRCRESTGLELHHRHAHALGGPHTDDNLELRCRAHNALAAEADFGREHMARARPSAFRTEA